MDHLEVVYEPNRFDEFTQLLNATESSERLRIADEIICVLEAPGFLWYADIFLFVERLLPWMKSTNTLVAVKALRIATLFLRSMRFNFRDCLPPVVPIIIYRLGDCEERVRKQCRLFVATMFETNSVTPNEVFRHFEVINITEKNSYARKSYLLIMILAINKYGLLKFNVKPLIPKVVKMLNDDSTEVQKTASLTLAVFYTYIGDKLKADIQKLFTGDPNLLIPLFNKLNYAKRSHMFAKSQSQEEMSDDYDSIEEEEPFDYIPHVVEPKLSDRIHNLFDFKNLKFDSDSQRVASMKKQLSLQDGDIQYLITKTNFLLRKVRELPGIDKKKYAAELESLKSE